MVSHTVTALSQCGVAQLAPSNCSVVGCTNMSCTTQIVAFTIQNLYFNLNMRHI